MLDLTFGSFSQIITCDRIMMLNMRCSILLCLACACLLNFTAAAKAASKPQAAAPLSGFFTKLKTKLQGDPRVKRKELLKERHRREWTLLEFVNGNAADCEVRLE
jgi:hypothetical protein